MATDGFDVAKVWLDYLVRLELVHAYSVAYRLVDSGGLEYEPLVQALPGLEYIKMAAILDDALEQYLDAKGLALPKRYHQTLGGRIRFCNDKEILPPSVSLGSVGDLRNALAHEPGSTTDWGTVQGDIALVQSALQHLGLIGVRPTLKVTGHRFAAYDQDKPGILLRQDYAVRVSDDNGAVVGQHRWTETIYGDEVT